MGGERSNVGTWFANLGAQSRQPGIGQIALCYGQRKSEGRERLRRETSLSTNRLAE